MGNLCQTDWVAAAPLAATCGMLAGASSVGPQGHQSGADASDLAGGGADRRNADAGGVEKNATGDVPRKSAELATKGTQHVPDGDDGHQCLGQHTVQAQETKPKENSAILSLMRMGRNE